MDILDNRRDRSAEMNIKVSCSEMGEGPGTGGKGLDGGRDSGGFGPGLGNTIGRGVGSGEIGICDGGTGKSSSSSGITSRRAARRDSVTVVVDMAASLEDVGQGGAAGELYGHFE